MKTKTLPSLKEEKSIPNVISLLLNDSFTTTKLFSMTLWKPAKRDQKLPSAAQSKNYNKGILLYRKKGNVTKELKEVSHQHLCLWYRDAVRQLLQLWSDSTMWLKYSVSHIQFLPIEAPQCHRPQHSNKIVLRSMKKVCPQYSTYL